MICVKKNSLLKKKRKVKRNKKNKKQRIVKSTIPRWYPFRLLPPTPLAPYPHPSHLLLLCLLCLLLLPLHPSRHSPPTPVGILCTNRIILHHC